MLVVKIKGITTQICSVLFSTIQYCSVLFSTTQYFAVPFTALQYYSVRFNTIQYQRESPMETPSDEGVATQLPAMLSTLVERCPCPERVPCPSGFPAGIWNHTQSWVTSLDMLTLRDVATRESIWMQKAVTCPAGQLARHYDARRHTAFLYISELITAWLSAAYALPSASLEQATVPPDHAPASTERNPSPTTAFKLAPISHRGMAGSSSKSPRPHGRQKHVKATRGKGSSHSSASSLPKDNEGRHRPR